MTNYNSPVWFFQDGQIEQTTYAKFLTEFYSDETTSPAGVMPKLHVSEVDRGDYNEDGDYLPDFKYVVSEWLCNGRKRTVETFDSEEEANDYVLSCWESDYQHHGGGPTAFFSYDEAWNDLLYLHNLPRSVNLHKISA